MASQIQLLFLIAPSVLLMLTSSCAGYSEENDVAELQDFPLEKLLNEISKETDIAEEQDEKLLNELNDEVILQKQSGMKVMYAYYGVSCANGNLKKSVQTKSTNYVNRLCNGKSSCRGYVHTRYLTDPYYGCQKDFIAIAKCPNGQVISSLVPKEAQGKYFSLQCQC